MWLGPTHRPWGKRRKRLRGALACGRRTLPCPAAPCHALREPVLLRPALLGPVFLGPVFLGPALLWRSALPCNTLRRDSPFHGILVFSENPLLLGISGLRNPSALPISPGPWQVPFLNTKTVHLLETLGRIMGTMIDEKKIRQWTETTFLSYVYQYATVGSTNDQARLLCATHAEEVPFVVVADKQTHGRGRGGKVWDSSDGSLTFSLVVPFRHLPPRQRVTQAIDPTLALRVALAVRAALASYLKEPAVVTVKWPNDVLIEGRKAAGILIESVIERTRWAIIGIGVNVNNQWTTSSLVATSIGQHVSRVPATCDVLGRILQQMEWIFADEQALIDRWQPHCSLTGRAVEVSAAVTAGSREDLPPSALQRSRVDASTVSGFCRGISQDGSLIVESNSRLHLVTSGTVRLCEVDR